MTDPNAPDSNPATPRHRPRRRHRRPHHQPDTRRRPQLRGPSSRRRGTSHHRLVTSSRRRATNRRRRTRVRRASRPRRPSSPSTAISWLVVLLVRVVPEGLPRAEAITVDGTVMAVTMLASLATGLLFGMLPALQASRADAGSVIKEGGGRNSARARGRAFLVVAEIALTLVLLVGAGLLGNSFVRLHKVDPGFKPEHVTVADLFIRRAAIRKEPDQTAVYHRLLEGLATRPELQAVGVGFPGPLQATAPAARFSSKGARPTTRADKPFAHIATISGGYFPSMGVPLLAGPDLQRSRRGKRRRRWRSSARHSRSCTGRAKSGRQAAAL